MGKNTVDRGNSVLWSPSGRGIYFSKNILWQPSKTLRPCPLYMWEVVFRLRHKALVRMVTSLRSGGQPVLVSGVRTTAFPVWQWHPSRRLTSPTSWGRVTDTRGVLTTASPERGRVGGATRFSVPRRHVGPKLPNKRPRELAGGRNLDGSCLAHEQGRVESTPAIRKVSFRGRAECTGCDENGCSGKRRPTQIQSVPDAGGRRDCIRISPRLSFSSR